MLSWLKNTYKSFVLIILFGLVSECIWSKDFSVTVNNVKAKLGSSGYELNADIDYNLSPTAKEALHKGIPLNWVVIIKIEKQGLLWDSTLQEVVKSYQIQNHALLNLFSVEKTIDGTTDIFSTLTAALGSISKIRNLPIIDQKSLQAGQNYHVAIKVLFNREALPVPLRPLSYFDPQWALSSRWMIWPLQK